MEKFKTNECFSCARYLSAPKPCETCAIIPYKGFVECVVCTKVIPDKDKHLYEPLKNFSGSTLWNYMKRYCICTECLQRSKTGRWELKLKEPVSSGKPTPDWR